MSEDQKTEEKTEDQKKGWITKLRDKWVQALIGTLIGLSITVPLAFFWGEGVKTVKTWYAERQNMSYDDALADAKENVGASTADVIPFRNADSNQQYIVVITDPPKSSTPAKNPYPSGSPENREFFLGEETQCVDSALTKPHKCYPIKILQKTEGASPEVIDPGLAAYDLVFDRDKYVDGKLVGGLTPEPEYRNSLLGVVDIDEDGNKEVYSLYRSLSGAGTGPYLIKIKLYDSLTGDIYELKGSAEPQSTTVNPQFTGKRPSETFAKWMNQQLNTLILFNGGTTTQDEEWGQMTDKDRYDKEVRDWVRDNGVGFDEGQVKAQEHEGQIPKLGSNSYCSIKDGNFEWRPYFKGALFVYDKSRDTHYVVWVPKSNYDMVAFTNILAGKQYLWLGLIKGDGLLVFNKGTQALEVVPVPELKGTPSPSPPNNYERANLVLQGSSLYAKVGLGGEKVVPLTLPDTINPTDEFKNAGTCTLAANHAP